MDLSVIIVSFNTKDLTLNCISSVKKNTHDIDYEIIVVDNASEDGSVTALRGLDVELMRNKENVGFAKANNQGVKKAQGRYVLFLNSDTLIENNVLGEMVRWMDENSLIGLASCMLRNRDGSIQPTGGYFPSLLTVFSWMTIQDFPLVDLLIKPFHPMHTRSFWGKGDSFYKKERELDWVTGAFYLTRKKILDEVGGFDEDYFMYVEEVDLAYRIKSAGWKVVYNPKWHIIHFGGASSETAEFPLLNEYKGIKRFYKKFYPSWQLPVLRFLLKLGSLGRMVLFGILEGKEAASVYVKAFKLA